MLIVILSAFTRSVSSAIKRHENLEIVKGDLASGKSTWVERMKKRRVAYYAGQEVEKRSEEPALISGQKTDKRIKKRQLWGKTF